MWERHPTLHSFFTFRCLAKRCLSYFQECGPLNLWGPCSAEQSEHSELPKILPCPRRLCLANRAHMAFAEHNYVYLVTVCRTPIWFHYWYRIYPTHTLSFWCSRLRTNAETLLPLRILNWIRIEELRRSTDGEMFFVTNAVFCCNALLRQLRFSRMLLRGVWVYCGQCGVTDAHRGVWSSLKFGEQTDEVWWGATPSHGRRVWGVALYRKHLGFFILKWCDVMHSNALF